MLKEQIGRAFEHCILQACKGDCVVRIDVNRRILPGRALFHKCVSNSEYFKHINVGMEVLKGRRYCKEVVLWQCGGMRAPLTTRSRMGLSKGMRALLTIRSRMGLGRGIRAPLTIRSRMGLGRGMRAPLTIRSRMGLGGGVAWAAIEEAGVTVFG